MADNYNNNQQQAQSQPASQSSSQTSTQAASNAPITTPASPINPEPSLSISQFNQNISNDTRPFNNLNLEITNDQQGVSYLTPLSEGGEITISFSETSKGWVSFKSFFPESGLSLDGKYYTINSGAPWVHHDKSVDMNTFYGNFWESNVVTVINEAPSSVKSFKTIEYEGTRSKVEKFITGEAKYPGQDSTSIVNDNQYYNLSNKDGWYVETIITNEQKGSVKEFIRKEDKYYNYIKGENTDGMIDKLDSKEFSYQGLGYVDDVDYVGPTPNKYLLIGDWSDANSFGAAEWNFMNNNVQDWNNNVVVAPWVYYLPYEDTDNSSDPFTVQGNLTLNIPEDQLQSGMVRRIIVKPKIVPGTQQPEQLTINNLGINRMFPRHCWDNTMPPLTAANFSTFTTPDYEIQPMGTIAPHSTGMTEYQIIPTVDHHGLGFNYFDKLGWPMHLMSQDADIYITKIFIKEYYDPTPLTPQLYPDWIEIDLTISDFQLDSLTDTSGNPTPASNKYIPVDIDYYELDLPTPVIIFALELEQTPLNGVYNTANGSQFHKFKETGFGLDIEFQQHWAGPIGIHNFSAGAYPMVISNSAVNNVPSKVILPAIENVVSPGNAAAFQVYIQTECRQYSDLDVDVVDGIFPDQLRFTPSQSLLVNAVGSSNFTTASYNWNSRHASGWPNTTLPALSSGQSTMNSADVYYRVNDHQNVPMTSLPGDNYTIKYPFMRLIIGENFVPNYDYTIQWDKVYHDLTNQPVAPVYGCTDPAASNYNPLATIDDGSCIACIYGCMDSTMYNYNPLATCDDGSCFPIVYGCTYSTADNYVAGANTDDGSCYWSACDDINATNYNLLCNVANMTTGQALLYGPNAIQIDNTCCEYSIIPCDFDNFEFQDTITAYGSTGGQILNPFGTGGTDVSLDFDYGTALDYWSGTPLGSSAVDPRSFTDSTVGAPNNVSDLVGIGQIFDSFHGWASGSIGNLYQGGVISGGVGTNFRGIWDGAWYLAWSETVPQYPNWLGWDLDLTGGGGATASWWNTGGGNITSIAGGINQVLVDKAYNTGLRSFDPSTSLITPIDPVQDRFWSYGMSTVINLGSSLASYSATYELKIVIDITPTGHTFIPNREIVMCLGNWHPDYCHAPWGPEREIVADINIYGNPSPGASVQGANYGIPSLISDYVVIPWNVVQDAQANGDTELEYTFTSDFDPSWVAAVQAGSIPQPSQADAMVTLHFQSHYEFQGELAIKDIQISCVTTYNPGGGTGGGGTTQAKERSILPRKPLLNFGKTRDDENRQKF